MRLFWGKKRPLNLILKNTHKDDFSNWIEHQPRLLSAEYAGWTKDHFVIDCSYGEPDETAENKWAVRQERIVILVMALKRDETEIEIVCNPEASYPRFFVGLIAKRWEETRDPIRIFLNIQPNEKPTIDAPKPLWEQIPDYRWDRLAVRLLYELKTNEEIAVEVSKTLSADITTLTVANQLSDIR